MSTVRSIARSWIGRPVRNWLRSPRATLTWAIDEARFRLGWTSVLKLRPGWTIHSHPAAYRCAYQLQDRDPCQRSEFDAFLQSCHEGMVLFDVGSHFGLFSLAALHFGRPNARAVAVDPSPTACRITRIQSELNGLADRLTVVQAAAGERTGQARMLPVGVQASGYFVPPRPDDPDTETVWTELVTLDDLARSRGLRPSHIKIDVEGGEAAVLRGASDLLQQNPAPLLFAEFHSDILRRRGEDPTEAVRILQDLGYHFSTPRGRRLDPSEFLEDDLARVIAFSARTSNPLSTAHFRLP